MDRGSRPLNTTARKQNTTARKQNQVKKALVSMLSLLTHLNIGWPLDENGCFMRQTTGLVQQGSSYVLMLIKLI